MPRRLTHQVHGYTARDLESGRGATHAPAITACTTFCQFVSLFSVQLTTQQRVLPAPPCQFSRPSATTRDQRANPKVRALWCRRRRGAWSRAPRKSQTCRLWCWPRRTTACASRPAGTLPRLVQLSCRKVFFSWRAAFGGLNRARHGSLPRASRGSARTCVRDQLP